MESPPGSFNMPTSECPINTSEVGGEIVTTLHTKMLRQRKKNVCEQRHLLCTCCGGMLISSDMQNKEKVNRDMQGQWKHSLLHTHVATE